MLALLVVAFAVSGFASIFRGKELERAYQDLIMREAHARTRAGDDVWSGVPWALRREPAYRFWFLPKLTRQLVRQRLAPPYVVRNPPAAVVADSRHPRAAPRPMNRALFLDRDGIVDELVYYESSGEWESPRTVADLRMLDATPLQRFVDAGWPLFIITNQPSYAKGKTSSRKTAGGSGRGGSRAPWPHHEVVPRFHRGEDQCDCRKPKPYFLHEATRATST